MEGLPKKKEAYIYTLYIYIYVFSEGFWGIGFFLKTNSAWFSGGLGKMLGCLPHSSF